MSSRLQKLASKIAKREGKRSQARIGDIREILGILSDVMHSCPQTYQTLAVAGFKRAQKKAKR
jgi:hypothetical protein